MLGVLFLTIALCSGFYLKAQDSGQTESEPILYPELAEELIEMRDSDQKLRIKWGGMIRKGKTGSKRYRALSKQLLAADRAHTQRMKEIVAEYGWPTFEKVGPMASRSAWVLVQHADRDPFFQAECLALMEEALEAEQVYPRNYAYLYDRVQVAFGEKQLYATQSTSNNGLWEGHFQPIAQESQVQERREDMGITRHVEEYAVSMGFTYTIPTEEEARLRSDSIVNAYRSHRDEGMKALESQDWKQAIHHLERATRCHGSVQAEDYVHLAKALSLSEDPAARRAFYPLIRAIVQGYEPAASLKTDPDLDYLRSLLTD
ncbi:MAG: hypothetical protein HKN79_09135, partial [Flavobacteriales bacterium]|nr:hypothetical protein [Flavobacteriales bacterium]